MSEQRRKNSRKAARTKGRTSLQHRASRLEQSLARRDMLRQGGSQREELWQQREEQRKKQTRRRKQKNKETRRISKTSIAQKDSSGSEESSDKTDTDDSDWDSDDEDMENAPMSNEELVAKSEENNEIAKSIEAEIEQVRGACPVGGPRVSLADLGPCLVRRLALQPPLPRPGPPQTDEHLNDVEDRLSWVETSLTTLMKKLEEKQGRRRSRRDPSGQGGHQQPQQRHQQGRGHQPGRTRVRRQVRTVAGTPKENIEPQTDGERLFVMLILLLGSVTTAT